MVTADRSSFIDEAFLCRHQYYLCEKLSHVGYGLFRYVCSLAPSTGNVALRSPIGFIRFSFAVELALRGYLTTETVADSIVMKHLKECLFEKFEHYFDNEIDVKLATTTNQQRRAFRQSERSQRIPTYIHDLPLSDA